MIVRELVTKLAFSTDHKQVQQYERAMQGLRRTAVLVSAAATAAAGALAGLSSRTAAYGDNVAKTSERLGIATDTLQEYRYAAELSGIASTTLDMALQRMGRRVGEAANGSGEAKDALERMGIATRDANGAIRETADLLPEVADYLSGLESANERNALAMKLFDSEGVAMVQMLKDGSAGLDDMLRKAREAGIVMDEDAIRASVEYTDSLAELKAMMTGLHNTIGGELLPRIVDSIGAFKEWYLANKAVIEQNLSGFVDALVTVLRSLWWMLRGVGSVVDRVAQWFGGWNNTLRLVGTAVATLVGLKLASWIWAVVRGGAVMLLTFSKIKRLLGIGLLVAAIDDLWNWVQGNKSAIGEVLGEWEAFHERFEWFFDNWKTWLGILATLIGVRLVANIIKATKQMRIFGNVGAAAGAKVTTGMGGKAGKAVGLIKWGAIGTAIGLGAGQLMQYGQQNENLAAIVSGGQQPENNLPIPDVASPVNRRTISNTYQFEFNVEGMSTPEEAQYVADLVGEEIDRRTREAQRQFPDAE